MDSNVGPEFESWSVPEFFLLELAFVTYRWPVCKPYFHTLDISLTVLQLNSVEHILSDFWSVRSCLAAICHLPIALFRDIFPYYTGTHTIFWKVDFFLNFLLFSTPRSTCPLSPSHRFLCRLAFFLLSRCPVSLICVINLSLLLFFSFISFFHSRLQVIVVTMKYSYRDLLKFLSL